VRGTLVITGANGNLGRRLLGAVSGRWRVRALVRSPSAAERIRALPEAGEVEVMVVDYLDDQAMFEALDGAGAVVHLVGIIKEPGAGAYRQAHEETCRVLAQAASAAGVERLVYLSILGAIPESANACLASKGNAEQILLEGAPPTRVLRVPMVLGEGDYASAALAKRARSRLNLLFRATSLEQPLYAGDLIDAIVASLETSEPVAGTLDLAGPESLTRAALTLRAARVLGRNTWLISLPLGWGLALAWLLERLATPPPVTRAMLGVLDHDDAIDPTASAQLLGVTLTSLDEMLTNCLSST